MSLFLVVLPMRAIPLGPLSDHAKNGGNSFEHHGLWGEHPLVPLARLNFFSLLPSSVSAVLATHYYPSLNLVFDNPTAKGGLLLLRVGQQFSAEQDDLY